MHRLYKPKTLLSCPRMSGTEISPLVAMQKEGTIASIIYETLPLCKSDKNCHVFQRSNNYLSAIVYLKIEG